MYLVTTLDADRARLGLVRDGGFFVFAPITDPLVQRFHTPVDAHNAVNEWVRTQGPDRVNETYSLSTMLVNVRIEEAR